MRIKRVPFCKTAIFTKSKYTSTGANKKINNYLGKKVRIIKYNNLYNSTNNVYIMTEDGFTFWCNYKDLIDNEVGLLFNINNLEKEMNFKLKDNISNNTELYNIIFKIIWEIEYSNLKFDELLESICTKFNINKEIILEIYFLFIFNTRD